MGGGMLAPQTFQGGVGRCLWHANTWRRLWIHDGSERLAKGLPKNYTLAPWYDKVAFSFKAQKPGVSQPCSISFTPPNLGMMWVSKNDQR